MVLGEAFLVGAVLESGASGCGPGGGSPNYALFFHLPVPEGLSCVYIYIYVYFTCKSLFTIFNLKYGVFD